MKKSVVVFGIGSMFKRNKKIIEDIYDIDILLDNSVELDKHILIDEKKCINPLCYDFTNNNILVCTSRVAEIISQIYSLTSKKMNINFVQCLIPDKKIKKVLSYGHVDIINDKVFFISEKINLRVRISNFNEIYEIFKIVNRYEYPFRNLIDNLPLSPIDENYASSRGQSIIRYYIDKFLKKNSKYIRGSVLEIGDRRYTKQYMNDTVKKSYCISVIDGKDDVIVANLETGDGLKKNFVDCIILTQVLPFIFNLDVTCTHIVEMLKPGGTALVTVHGISQIHMAEYESFGDFWRLTDKALYNLFINKPKIESVRIEQYGNVKSATSFLYGLSAEDLGHAALDYVDKRYPVLIACVVKKANNE